MENTTLQTELTKLLKNRFSESESTRSNYARGEDTYDPVLSQAVVFPKLLIEESEEEALVLIEKFHPNRLAQIYY